MGKTRTPKKRCVLCKVALTPTESPEIWLHPVDESTDCGVRVTDALGLSADDTYFLADDGQVYLTDEAAAAADAVAAEQVAVQVGTGPIYVIGEEAPPSESAWVSSKTATAQLFAAAGVEALGGMSGLHGWSSLSTFQRCQHLWNIRYGSRRPRADVPQSEVLEVGDITHVLLAIRYMRMMLPDYPLDPPGAIEFLRAALITPAHLDEAVRIFAAYEMFYGDEDYLTVLAVEHECVDPRTGRSCRWDLVIRIERPFEGLLPGVYLVNHKCLRGDAVVWDYKTNRLWTVADLHRSGLAPEVLAVDVERGQPVRAQASVEADAIRDVFEVTTQAGRQLATSDNHPFLTARGWIQAADLSTDDWVAVPRNTSVGEFEATVTVDEVHFVGSMIAEGCTVSGNFTYTQNPGSALDAFVATVTRLTSLSDFAVYKNPKRQAVTVRMSFRHDAPLRQLLEHHGVWGRASADQRVPTQFMSLPDSLTGVLLGSLWDGDGAVEIATQGYPTIRYSTISQQLARDVQVLLLRLGIPSTVTKQTMKVNGEPYDYYVTTVVTRTGKRCFLQHVGSVIPTARLQSIVDAALAVLTDDDDEEVPIALIVNQLFDIAPKPHAVSQWLSNVKRNPAKTIQRETLMHVCPSVRLDSTVRWERVADVRKVEQAQLYNLSVPGFQNFVANDLVTHNTSARDGKAVREGWRGDGQIIGEWDLYHLLRYDRRWGAARGICVNLIMRQKSPVIDRLWVVPSKVVVKDQQRATAYWTAQMAMAKSTGYYPRSRAACITRSGGLCEEYERCSGMAAED